MKIKRIKHLITKLLTNSASAAERAEFAKWMNSEEVEANSREAWESASVNIEQSLKNEIWDYLQLKIKEPFLTYTPKKQKQTSKRRIFSIPRIAASIAIIVGATFSTYLLYNNYTGSKEDIKDNTYTFEVKPGQKGSMNLADGTVVHLNSASKISFTGDYNSKERVVTLDGEAYFEVAKNPNKRFVVTCNGIDIEALGTEFNVKAYPTDSIITTTLAKGKVRVYNKAHSVTLLPNGVATYNLKRQTIKSSTIQDISIADYWRTGQLVYNAESLSSIAKTIERMYNVKININDEKLREMEFSGTIQNNSLINVLYIISLSYPLTYTLTDSVITISAQDNEIKKYR
ncbi:MAG: DUF4974 domain-containing protein [Massilibacteroides sp.]|nr:DUF4974 domain-containing protein [Massilibacteroides sp.]MDD3063693.1 DUF4974 domain-containing protein [Massilibacteroides sp.]MDD4115296.1 DUF4974 domain-containing protein [Massilibacteroides sp.]MDD4660930.1 DUF4974 domain-containing protein [Massilibacteroides sp.]